MIVNISLHNYFKERSESECQVMLRLYLQIQHRIRNPHKPQSLYQKKRHTSDIVLRIVIYTATAITVAALIGIIGYILWNGIPHITWSFLSSPYSETRASMKGILPMIINTLYIVVITLVDIGPIGISAAIYLTQYAKAKENLFAQFVLPQKFFPAFHLSYLVCLGYTVFCILFRLQTSINAGCLTMAICVLPTIIQYNRGSFTGSSGFL